MLRDLLVHVDSSEAGCRRVRFAVALAALTGARLSGLHVIPPPEVIFGGASRSLLLSSQVPLLVSH